MEPSIGIVLPLRGSEAVVVIILLEVVAEVVADTIVVQAVAATSVVDGEDPTEAVEEESDQGGEEIMIDFLKGPRHHSKILCQLTATATVGMKVVKYCRFR